MILPVCQSVGLHPDHPGIGTVVVPTNQRDETATADHRGSAKRTWAGGWGFRCKACVRLPVRSFVIQGQRGEG